MSLRARLLVGLVVLAAAGLTVVGVVTYAEQRSFLLQRVDQQAIAAPQSVSRALDDAGVLLVGAVGKIQPGYIHSNPHQVAQHRFGIAGGPHSTNDLGTTRSGRGWNQSPREIS